MPDWLPPLLNGLLGGLLALGGNTLLEWRKNASALHMKERDNLGEREDRFNAKIVELLSMSARRRARIAPIIYEVAMTQPEHLTAEQRDLMLTDLPEMEAIQFYLVTIFGSDSRSYFARTLVEIHQHVAVDLHEAQTEEDFENISNRIMNQEIMILNMYIALHRAEMKDKIKDRRFRGGELEEVPQPPKL